MMSFLSVLDFTHPYLTLAYGSSLSNVSVDLQVRSLYFHVYGNGCDAINKGLGDIRVAVTARGPAEERLLISCYQCVTFSSLSQIMTLYVFRLPPLKLLYVSSSYHATLLYAMHIFTIHTKQVKIHKTNKIMLKDSTTKTCYKGHTIQLDFL